MNKRLIAEREARYAGRRELDEDGRRDRRGFDEAKKLLHEVGAYQLGPPRRDRPLRYNAVGGQADQGAPDRGTARVGTATAEVAAATGDDDEFLPGPHRDPIGAEAQYV